MSPKQIISYWICGHQEDHLFCLVDLRILPIILSTSWLPRSTAPWDCGWRGLPLIVLRKPSQFFNKFLITLLTNSLPLSDWRMYNIPKYGKTLSAWLTATSTASLLHMGNKIWNLEKWSVTWPMNLYSPSGLWTLGRVDQINLI